MSQKVLYILCFTLAFLLRIIVINQSKGANEHIDLKIYRDAGQLVINGINPYDFSHNIELRNKLRLDKDNYDEWLASDQHRWDSFAASNLPLATLLFGAIEYVSQSPKSYRLVFAFLDSLLAVVIFAFVTKKWSFTSSGTSRNKTSARYVSWATGLLLGVFCPILLLWGAKIPEPKGTCILLILSAVYFSDSPKKVYSMFVSPLLLGFSVAFMGLGIFIVPACLVNIYIRNNFKAVIAYSTIAFLACIAWLIPFMPSLLTMMAERSSISSPQFGSMWLPVYNYAPSGWLTIKNIFSLIFIVINLIGLIRGRLNLIVLSASLIFFFTCIHLTSGSLDRMNIALLTSIILIGYAKFTRFAVLLSSLYLIYGAFILFLSFKGTVRQDFDGLFVLAFTVIYSAFLIIQSFGSHPTKSETKHLNPSI